MDRNGKSAASHGTGAIYLRAMLPALGFFLIEELIIAGLSELSRRGAAPLLRLFGAADLRVLIVTLAALAGTACFGKDAMSYVRLFEKKEKTDGTHENVRGMAALFIGACLLSLGINVLLSLAGGARGESGTLYEGSFPLLLFSFALITPWAEELIFRGRVYLALLSYLGEGKAVVLQGLLFAAIHGEPAQMVYAFVMGSLFAYAYGRTRRFMVPVGIHALCNALTILLSVSGIYVFLCTPLCGAVFLGGGILLLVLAAKSVL